MCVTNPWIDIPASPPYQLMADAPLLFRFNEKSKPEFQLQLHLLPEPFVGAATAPVVLLYLNPGYSPDDIHVHERQTVYTAIRRTLRHERHEYPFYYFDPSENGPGHSWCRSRFAKLLKHVPVEVLASRILMVEYFPYHSEKFRHASLRLPSQEYGFHLVREALARNAVVVIMRGDRLWHKAVPELASYHRLYRLNSRQNVTLSRRNCPDGFEAVLAAVRGANLT